MKKKWIAAAAACMLALTACGGNDEITIGGDTASNVTAAVESEASAEQETAAEAVSAKGYTFDYNGTEIAVDTKMDGLLEQLGEEDSYFEAPSCAFDGVQRIYTYGSMELDTYIGDDGEDYLDAIILKDDLVSTPEGVRVGDTPETVVEVYGDGYTDNNGSYTYEKDGMKLNVIMEDGAVVSIQYKSEAVG